MFPCSRQFIMGAAILNTRETKKVRLGSPVPANFSRPRRHIGIPSVPRFSLTGSGISPSHEGISPANEGIFPSHKSPCWGPRGARSTDSEQSRRGVYTYAFSCQLELECRHGENQTIDIPENGRPGALQIKEACDCKLLLNNKDIVYENYPCYKRISVSEIVHVVSALWSKSKTLKVPSRNMYSSSTFATLDECLDESWPTVVPHWNMTCAGTHRDNKLPLIIKNVDDQEELFADVYLSSSFSPSSDSASTEENAVRRQKRNKKRKSDNNYRKGRPVFNINTPSTSKDHDYSRQVENMSPDSHRTVGLHPGQSKDPNELTSPTLRENENNVSKQNMSLGRQNLELDNQSKVEDYAPEDRPNRSRKKEQNPTKVQQELHLRLAKSARAGMKLDAEKGKDRLNDVMVISFDLMKTLPTPVLLDFCHYKVERLRHLLHLPAVSPPLRDLFIDKPNLDQCVNNNYVPTKGDPNEQGDDIQDEQVEEYPTECVNILDPSNSEM
ncbi:hypothetical protein J6590_092488 [Homalodisca vitripennis]|nr:hypothetical protein J6590_092488 [Homalodisca vitripennis]